MPSGVDVADHLAGHPDIFPQHVSPDLRAFFDHHIAQRHQISDQGAAQRPVVFGTDLAGDDRAGIDGVRRFFPPAKEGHIASNLSFILVRKSYSPPYATRSDIKKTLKP